MTYTDAEPDTLEHALSDVEAEAEATLRTLLAAAKQARRAKSAAAAGQVRDLAQSLEAVVALADSAAEAARRLRSGWRFDVPRWFSSGEYTKELLAAAAEAELGPLEDDQRILCYPAVIEVSASDISLAIDKRKERKVRPSAVVAQLSALRDRSSKLARPEAFIESLAAAYDLAVAFIGGRPGVPVKLSDVHRVLTLRPGAARAYTRQELARDLYLLDQTGIVNVKDGRRLTLPASATTRNAPVLTTVTRGGQAKIYAAIAFVQPAFVQPASVQPGDPAPRGSGR
ncbi:MAG: hypothetical protein ACRDY2_01325 [Acidimicrobiales bacterium]